MNSKLDYQGEIIALLYEKSYHFGVGAFLNSVARAQFIFVVQILLQVVY